MPLLEQTVPFALPPELEARQPPEARGLRRDEVRMLVSRRSTDSILHAQFVDLPDFLSRGDLVVANDSGTLPAEVTATRGDGAPVALRLSSHLPSGLWSVEPRDMSPNIGETLILPGGGEATLLLPHRSSHRLWEAALQLPLPLVPYLLEWGRPIKYAYVSGEWPLDMYQTVYHGELGSAEMPSAGRPFTPTVIERLRDAGIGFATLTLHTGVSSLESPEPPYEEFFRIPAATAEAINETHATNGRVIAVGTTVVRALESATTDGGLVAPAEGWTDLVIEPDRTIDSVDGLLTGFHEPRASHLAMLEAIAGRDHLAVAYHAALDSHYLWHEFGDVHLLL